MIPKIVKDVCVQNQTTNSGILLELGKWPLPYWPLFLRPKFFASPYFAGPYFAKAEFWVSPIRAAFFAARPFLGHFGAFLAHFCPKSGNIKLNFGDLGVQRCSANGATLRYLFFPAIVKNRSSVRAKISAFISPALIFAGPYFASDLKISP